MVVKWICKTLCNMKLKNILMSLFLENKKQRYQYGCTMLYFNFPEINKIHDMIDNQDVYEEESDRSFGLEKEPHTTLLYGSHENVSDDDIRIALNDLVFGECELYNASLFKNEKYDVLKFDVSGKNLNVANNRLKEFPYTSDFPDYHPHLTIAYLKSGEGDKYVKKLKDYKTTLLPKKAVYSKPNGDKVDISIKVQK